MLKLMASLSCSKKDCHSHVEIMLTINQLASFLTESAGFGWLPTGWKVNRGFIDITYICPAHN